MAFIAPAGTPVSLTDLLNGLGAGLSGANAASELSHALASHAARSQCWLLSTGRAAMTLLLQAMRAAAQDERRVEVIIPAYTCYSVAASVARAGLKPRLCDIDPRTLSPNTSDLERFDPQRVLAVVSANLYGIPNALAEIERWAHARGVMMLDDAAQALGACYRGRPVGSFGDAGIYSFDKGKNITSLEGGAIIASRPLAQAIAVEVSRLPPPPRAHTLTTVMKLVIYSILLRPYLYGIIRALPFLGLGRTVYEDTYPIARYSDTLAGLTRRLYERLPRLTEARTRNAEAMRAALSAVPEVRQIALSTGSIAAYTRLPILVESNRRADFIRLLESNGIGATASYPHALCDVPEIAPLLHPEDLSLPGAQEVARSIVTLPTHPYCPADMPERVRAIAASTLRQR